VVPLTGASREFLRDDQVLAIRAPSQKTTFYLMREIASDLSAGLSAHIRNNTTYVLPLKGNDLTKTFRVFQKNESSAKTAQSRGVSEQSISFCGNSSFTMERELSSLRREIGLEFEKEVFSCLGCGSFSRNGGESSAVPASGTIDERGVTIHCPCSSGICSLVELATLRQKMDTSRHS